MNDNHLTEEIEIEEVYDDLDQDTKDTYDNYNKRKQMYATKIMAELEGFTQSKAEDWQINKEEELIDIMSLVDNLIRAQLSSNDYNYKG